MKQNQYNKTEYLKQLQEIKAEDGQQVLVTTNVISELINKGEILKEEGEWYINRLEDQNSRIIEWQKISLNNQNMTEEERLKELSKCFGSPVENDYKFWIINAKIVAALFKSTQKKVTKRAAFKDLAFDEFPIRRLMADLLNHLYKLLILSAPEHMGEDIYTSESITEISSGSQIKLKYRCRAPNQEEANKKQEAFLQRILKRQLRVFLACVKMAYEKGGTSLTSDVRLTDLMKTAYPNRQENHFNQKDKIEFYQDVLDLSETSLSVVKKNKKNPKENDEFPLPFITLHKITTSQNGTKYNKECPREISFSVMHNPLLEKDKMYWVAAGIKDSTLELHIDDLYASTWFQIRKNQLQGKEDLPITRKQLIEMFDLNIKHSGMANKKLLQKLNRLKAQGTIQNYPTTIEENMIIKI